MLDIGAGNGLLAIPLSQNIGRYVAVEPKAGFVEKLRSHDLDVIQSNFPTPVHEKFDLVLSSHSMSYEKGKYESFINEAFQLLNPNGVFLIVTYRGEEDDWNDLLAFLGQNRIDSQRASFHFILELLNTLGNVSVRKVTTEVMTKNIDDMIQALSFVFSDGNPEKKEVFLGYRTKLEEILDSKYKTEHGYSFPFQHFFIATQKK